MPSTLRTGDALAFERPLGGGSCRGEPRGPSGAPTPGAARLAPPPALLFVRSPLLPGRVPVLALAEPPATPAPPAAPGDCISGIGSSMFEARRRWRPDQLPSKRFSTPPS